MRHDKTELHLYFIRHAESEQNKKPHLIGGQSPDTPLTELGWKQALALGQRFAEDGLQFDILFCSPFVRTRSTVAGMLRSCPPPERFFTADDLVELSQGEWEGVSRRLVYEEGVVRRMAEKHFDFAAPGGESIRMVQRRAANWLEDNILNNPAILAVERPQHFAFVTHGITIKSLIQYVMGFERAMTWRIAIDNTSISHFKLDARGWWPKTINDTAHLRGL